MSSHRPRPPAAPVFALSLVGLCCKHPQWLSNGSRIAQAGSLNKNHLTGVGGGGGSWQKDAFLCTWLLIVPKIKATSLVCLVRWLKGGLRWVGGTKENPPNGCVSTSEPQEWMVPVGFHLRQSQTVFDVYHCFGVDSVFARHVSGSAVDSNMGVCYCRGAPPQKK